MKSAVLKVALVLVLLLLGCLAGTYGWYQWALGPADESGPEVDFRVPKGTSARQVGKLLYKERLIRSPLAWSLYLKLHEEAPAPKAGLHKIRASMDVPELLVALASRPGTEDVDVTMVEGWRLRDADAALAAKGLISEGAYSAAAANKDNVKSPIDLAGSSLEGYLLPDTFRVPAPGGKLDVSRLLQMQVEAFWKRFAKPNADEIRRSGRSLRDLVILASLLEREEPNPANRPMVAGVLYRRLKLNTPLGVDATSRFTLENWNDRKAFLKKLRDPNDKYNTRVRKGLPPGPIGAPSLSSLEAALRPKKSPYLYYLHDKQGNIHFARNGEGHEANRKKYDVW